MKHCPFITVMMFAQKIMILCKMCRTDLNWLKTAFKRGYIMVWFLFFFCLSFIVCIVEEGFHSTTASLRLLCTEELDTQTLSRSALSTLCGCDLIRLDWQWPGKHEQTSHQLSSHFDSSVTNFQLEPDITFSWLRAAHFKPVKGVQTQTWNMEIPHVKQLKLLQVWREKKTHHWYWEAEAEKIGFQGRYNLARLTISLSVLWQL